MNGLLESYGFTEQPNGDWKLLRQGWAIVYQPIEGKQYYIGKLDMETGLGFEHDYDSGECFFDCQEVEDYWDLKVMLEGAFGFPEEGS